MDDNTIALTLILDLQRQILALRQRIAELEAKEAPPPNPE